jgi:hypothetical protein
MEDSFSAETDGYHNNMEDSFSAETDGYHNNMEDSFSAETDGYHNNMEDSLSAETDGCFTCQQIPCYLKNLKGLPHSEEPSTSFHHHPNQSRSDLSCYFLEIHSNPLNAGLYG